MVWGELSKNRILPVLPALRQTMQSLDSVATRNIVWTCQTYGQTDGQSDGQQFWCLTYVYRPRPSQTELLKALDIFRRIPIAPSDISAFRYLSMGYILVPFHPPRWAVAYLKLRLQKYWSLRLHQRMFGY